MLLTNQEQYKTTNTFTRSPSIAQIVVYLVSICQILTAYLIIQNRFTDNLYIFRMVFIVVYGLLVCGKIISSGIVSAIDPSDQLMVLCRSKKTVQTETQIIKTKQQIKNYLFCRECITFVKPESKHCKKCQRCVQYFDHHCIWLNNCIGCRNYKEFIWMLWVVQLEMTMFMIGCSFLWAEHRYTGDSALIGVEGRYHLYEIVLVWVMMFVTGVFWILNCNLIILHMYLIKIGKTTYEWLFPIQVANKKMIATRIVSSRQTVSNDEGIVGNVNTFQQNNEVRDQNSVTVSNQLENSEFGQVGGIGGRNLTLDHIPNVSGNKILLGRRQQSSSSSHRIPNRHKNSLPTPKNNYKINSKQTNQANISKNQQNQQQPNSNTMSIFGNSLKLQMFQRHKNKIFPYIEQDQLSVQDKNLRKSPINQNFTQQNLHNQEQQQPRYMPEITYPIDDGYAGGSQQQSEESGSNHIKTGTEPGSEDMNQRNYNMNQQSEISRDRNLYNSVKIMRKQPEYLDTLEYEQKLKQSQKMSNKNKKDSQNPTRKLNTRARSLQSILSMINLSQITEPIKITQVPPLPPPPQKKQSHQITKQ